MKQYKTFLTTVALLLATAALPAKPRIPLSADYPGKGQQNYLNSPSKLEGVPRRGEGACQSTTPQGEHTQAGGEHTPPSLRATPSNLEGEPLRTVLPAPVLPARGSTPSDNHAAESLPVREALYIFHFMPGRDMFYVPWHGNGEAFDRLAAAVEQCRPQLEAGEMYLNVSSYAATGNANTDPARMAYLRNSRVKSALIQRLHLKERMFVTDHTFTEPYTPLPAGGSTPSDNSAALLEDTHAPAPQGGTPSNLEGESMRHESTALHAAESLPPREADVVVVTFPASVEKVEQIAGPAAAEKVRTYYYETIEQPRLRLEAQQRARVERLRADSLATVRRQAEQAEAVRQAEAQAAAEAAALAARQQAISDSLAAARRQAYPLRDVVRHPQLRVNLATWVLGSPGIGLAFNLSPRWQAAIDGSYGNWNVSHSHRATRITTLALETRRYFSAASRGGRLSAACSDDNASIARRTSPCGKHQFYIGLDARYIHFNRLHGDGIGSEGNQFSVGPLVGYTLRLTAAPRWSFDASVGCGYRYRTYDRYTWYAPANDFRLLDHRNRSGFGLTNLFLGAAYQF